MKIKINKRYNISIAFPDKEKKELVQNFLNHIKNKTGKHNYYTVFKALEKYNMEI